MTTLHSIIYNYGIVYARPAEAIQEIDTLGCVTVVENDSNHQHHQLRLELLKNWMAVQRGRRTFIIHYYDLNENLHSAVLTGISERNAEAELFLMMDNEFVDIIATVDIARYSKGSAE